MARIIDKDTRLIDIDFGATLEAMTEGSDGGGLLMTDSRHIQNPLSPGSRRMVITVDDSVSIGNDQNSVDIDKEIGKLRTNKINYNLLAQLTALKFRQLKQAIRGE